MEHQQYIKATNISKAYNINNDSFHALKDVSFYISQGERVGIIGSNGAGKSTLLNIISGFADATQGSVEIAGKVSPILDIGTSIQPEMTGRDNLYIGGELHGLSRAETDDKIQEIIDFIDIGDYLDQPMRTYSSGMKARLAFGIISFIKPEILIIDEALGVGDAAFAAKSAAKMEELCREGKILMVVSHSMDTIRNMTNRCLWLDHGRLIMDGPSGEVTKAYQLKTRNQEMKRLRDTMKRHLEQSRLAGAADLTNLYLTCLGDNKPINIFELFDDIQFNITITANQQLPSPDIQFSIEDMYGKLLIHSLYSKNMSPLPTMEKKQSLSLTITMPNCGLGKGVYEYICTVLSANQIAAQRREVFEITNTHIIFPAVSIFNTDGCLTARLKN